MSGDRAEERRGSDRYAADEPLARARLRLAPPVRETDLYPPVKAYLEAQGYTVKAEVDGCDVVARRGDEAPVLVELKLALNLELVLQAIERQTVSDAVYVAVPDDRRTKSRTLVRRAFPDVVRLLRLLGLGLMVVTFRARAAKVDVAVDPGPYRPRKSARKRARLLREFELLRGDYNVGGSRGAQVTAYRQDALACAAFLSDEGVRRPVEIRKATGVARAAQIVYDNHYGWFEHLGPGAYRLSEKGVEALGEYRAVVEDLTGGGSPTASA